MSEVWYKDESCDNYRDDCHFDPPRLCTLEELKASTGVEVYKVWYNFKYYIFDTIFILYKAVFVFEFCISLFFS